MTQPFTVLALTRHINGFYAGEMIAGIVREVSAAGGSLVVVQAHQPDDDYEKLSPTPFDIPVALGCVDGVITVAPAATHPLIDELREAGKPVVVASERMPGVSAPVALPDNWGGVRAGVEHLIAHGHTRIGFVADMSQHDFRERRAAYEQVMAEHGLPAGEDLFFPASNYGEHGGIAAAQAFLARAGERPTAVMTATDENAFAFIRELGAAGISVPRDLAVVGFDDVEHAVFSTPSLSSVAQRFDEVGALSARLVIRMIRGEHVEPVDHVARASVLIPRGSCGCRHDTLTADPAADPTAIRTDADETRAMLHTLLDHRRWGSITTSDVDRLVAAVEGLHDRDDARAAVADLVGLVDRIAPDADARQHVVGALTEYLQRLVGLHPERAEDLRVSRATAALWQLQAYGAVQQGHTREASVLEHGYAANDILQNDADRAKGLAWLEQTHVRAGVLALWDGPPADRRLRVVGAYQEAGDPASTIGDALDARQFPPEEFVRRVDPSRGEACVVVPVRNVDDDWGLLAVIAVVSTTWNREPYKHWAHALCLTLAGERLQQAVRDSEARYAYAAQASNDGLWELDLRTREMYLSARCRDLSGLPQDAAVGTEQWQAHILPEDVDGVVATFTAALEHPGRPVQVEYRVRGVDGRARWVLSRGIAVPGPDGRPVRMVGSLADVDTRRELEEQLRQGALYDDVTGLPNRRLFLDRLEAAILQTSRRPDTGYAVIFLDLDGFKLVNDSLGHLLGDELLRTVAERLLTDLRSVDTAARFGGDEFALLLSDPVPEEVLVIARRIQDRIAAPVMLDGTEVSVTASVGIATSATGYTDAEEVLRDSDIAMYHAKESERGSASMFDRVMHTRAAGRLRARAELRTALAEQQFVVHYQPIVALDGAPLVHYEALVRWQHPERGLLGPHEFLPAMEDNSTIVTLGQWVMAEVCRQIAAWRDEHGRLATVSVNLSHREFWTRTLRSTVTECLERHDLPTSALVLEITESVIMSDPDTARRTMASLRETGVHLHVDDFGTGHSSLTALRTFPVDALKIDGSFIRELDVVHQTTELVRIIIDMGAALGLDVVAECVETPEQAGRLRGMGCANAQGWLYARALPADEAGQLLGRRLGALEAAEL